MKPATGAMAFASKIMGTKPAPKKAGKLAKFMAKKASPMPMKPVK